MRDWIASLWPASFRGVLFQVEADHHSGGRRLAVHEFANSETWFVEDLGRSVRVFQVTAYLASDTSDSDAAALRSTLEMAGPGVLVLPVEGTLNAYLRNFERAYQKDRMGYIAFSLNFVAQGASSPLTSALMLAQLVYDAVDNLAAAASASAAGINVLGQAGWVSDAAITALQDIPAAVETVRASAIIDPAVGATLQTTLSNVYNAVPDGVSSLTGLTTTVVADSIAAARALGAAMVPSAATADFGAAIDDFAASPGATGTTQTALTVAANALLAQQLAVLALLTAYVESLIATNFPDRPSGVAARQAMAARFETIMAPLSGAADMALYQALEDLRTTAVTYFSTVVANLPPLVTASANANKPSLVWAWELYQDLTKAADLVARNKAHHPAWMPPLISALAPTALI